MQVVSEPAEQGEIVHTGQPVDEWFAVLIQRCQAAHGVIGASDADAIVGDRSVVSKR